MSDRPESGRLLGIPYNFERPSIGRLLASYWQPGKGMIVEKPFGLGYTLNLANWRSWILLAVAGGLVWLERRGGASDADTDSDEPIEIVVDDED